MHFNPLTPDNDPTNPFFHPLNEEVKTIDKKKAKDIYDKLKKGSEVEVDFGNAITRGGKPITLKVTSGHRVVGASKVGRIILVDKANPRGMKYKLFDRNGSVSLAQSDMGTILRDMKIVKEGVEELDEEKKKPISTRLGDAFDSGELEDRIKSMSGPARKSFTDLANSLTDFYHTTKDIHQVDGRQLEDKIDGSPTRVRKMFAKLLDEDVQLDESRDDFDYLDAQAASEDRMFAAKKFMDALKKARIKHEYIRSSGTMRVAKKDLGKAQSIGKKLKVDKDGVRMDVLKEDVQLDEMYGTKIKVVVKGDENVYERMTRALMYARLPGYEGATFNKSKGVTTYAFDAKKHTAAVRKKFAKIIQTHNGNFVQSIEEAKTPFSQKISSAQDKLRKAGIKSAFQFGEVYVENKDLKKAEKLVGSDKDVIVVGVPFLRKDEIDEGFASDAQRRAAFASGYKAKGKKNKKSEEEFSKTQLSSLKKEYDKINKINPESPTYKKLKDKIRKMDTKMLQQVYDAKIKFMRGLAFNELSRRGKQPKV